MGIQGEFDPEEEIDPIGPDREGCRDGSKGVQATPPLWHVLYIVLLVDDFDVVHAAAEFLGPGSVLDGKSSIPIRELWITGPESGLCLTSLDLSDVWPDIVAELGSGTEP